MRLIILQRTHALHKYIYLHTDDATLNCLQFNVLSTFGKNSQLLKYKAFYSQEAHTRREHANSTQLGFEPGNFLL